MTGGSTGFRPLLPKIDSRSCNCLGGKTAGDNIARLNAGWGYSFNLLRRLDVILYFFLLGSAAGLPDLSEFMASNETTLADEDGDFPDWIELANPGTEAIDLGGYYLTDDRERPTRWELPTTVLSPGEFLIVYASGKDRKSGELHANFRLAAGGESLALVAPDGLTVVSDFGGRYPPQFEDVSYGRGEFGTGYLDTPSPGAANGSGQLPGPVFLEVRRGGPRPAVAENLVITARVRGAESVTLFHRRGFGPESAVLMDTGDGENFLAPITGGIAGELIRWRFEASDSNGTVTREPPFGDPGDSPEYHGVPVVNPEVESRAQVMEWFITPENYRRLNFFGTVRAGLYFNGEYYDNVRFSTRGQSTRFFDKKGYEINFNRSQRFRWKDGEERVDEIDLLTNWGDKAKVRNEMAYEILREAGVPTHFAETIRLQRNREFYSLTDMVESASDIYLERAGLNPEGTLYKADNLTLHPDDIGRPGIARVQAGQDDEFARLHHLIRALNRDVPERWDFIFEQVDLPMTINTLAGLVTIMQTDMGAKNYYLYFDPEGAGEWSILPWDLDLTFGRNFTRRAGYFDRNLYSIEYTEFAESQNTSVLVEELLRGNPRTRAMFFRRLRTLSDQYLVSDYLVQRTREQLDRLSPTDIQPNDAFLDLQRWGTWYDGNIIPQPWDVPNRDAETMERAVERLLTEWLPDRRFEFSRFIPDLPEPAGQVSVSIGALDFDPISDNQDQEYLELVNRSPTAVDLSGWRVAGAVRMTLPPGTVVPAGGSLFLSPEKAAFLTREESPTGGEQRFVLGSYEGNLAAEGETIQLFDQDNTLRDSHTYSGRNPGFNGDSREDKDGDGLSALLEWALGTSDENYNGLPAPDDKQLTFVIRSNLNGFLLVPEISRDLGDWTSADITEVARVPRGDSFDEVTLAWPPEFKRAYVRLRLVRP